MNICYLGYLRIPTEKAHGFQIMKMCEAFASLGHEVELVIPKRKNLLTEDAFVYYGIPSGMFSIREINVGTFDLYHTSRWAIKMKDVFYCSRFLLRLRRLDFPRGTIVYTRNATIAWWVGIRFPDLQVIYEAHGVSKNFWFQKWLLRSATLVVAITEGIVNDYRRLGYKGRMVVEADAYDPEVFVNMESKESLRTALGLPLHAPLVLYTGSFSLYGWKGADVLIAAAQDLRGEVRVVLVGGSNQEMKDMEARLPSDRFICVSRVSRKKVAQYLCAADVLVLPNKKGDVTSERYTSPLKLFEYMASGTPIVASDLPSIREVLDESSATLVEPNNPKALAEGVLEVLHNRVSATARAQEARKKVEYYTWNKRTKRIIEALSGEK